LVLNGINLNTSLPKDVGGLTQLQSLWLRDCNLSGSIPTSFGSLSNLTRVVLNENNIGGCWPQTMVGMCSQFTTSSFDDNLSSAISDGGWSYFCATSGSGNAMHPEYDAMVALYNALNGSGWDSDTGWDNGDGTVSCNPCDGSWQGVTCDAITKNVSEIDLSGNNLTGSIPPEIGDLLDLESLELSDNAITGVIPVEIGNLSKLEHLALATNSLVGPLPSSMRRLTNLSTLYINENNITGCWPSGWEDLCQEGTLVFADNNLSASISDSGWDDFCDDGLNTVHPDFDALAALYHSTGGAGWTHNTNWDVDYSCSDPCADAWFGIDCSGGRVITVDLGNNNLIGQIPEEIGDLFFLENLNLSQNSLTGSIPDEITDLNRLEEMSLTQNKLTGVIPSDLFTLPNLYFLNLSSNDLSGTLPLDISAGAMEVIDLSDNFLSGLVTRGFPNVIDNVDLSDNYFSSASPYFSWTYANDIDLSNNNLQGCFSEAWWALCSSGTSVDLSLNPGLGSLYNFCENGGQGGCSTCTDDDVSIGYEFFNIPHIGSSYHYTKVSNDITADVRIRDPKTVLFSAGNSIDLEAGFQVDLGAKFQAVIDECEFVEGTVISDTPISPIKK